MQESQKENSSLPLVVRKSQHTNDPPVQNDVNRRKDPLLNADITVYNFHPGRCNVCLVEHGTADFPRYPTPLLQCLGCRLSTYCGPVHQRCDWKYHKYLCRAIKSILDRYKLAHIYEIRGSIRYGSLKSLNETKHMIRRNLEVEMRREMDPHEKAAVYFPKMCVVCYEWNPKKLVICPMCESAWFCREDPHREQQCQDVHRPTLCDLLKLHYSIVVVGNQRTIGPPPDSLKLTEGESFPADLFSLINVSSGANYTDKPNRHEDYVNFAAVCNFSNVATLTSAIRQAQLLKPGQKTLSVHVVGAHTEIALFSVHECWLFFRWLPSDLSAVHLDFIGPDLPDGLIERTEYNYGPYTCRLRYHQSTYEALPSDFGKPDICMCFNSGFNERPSDNPWLPAIERMIDTSPCIAFTSYVRLESQQDLELLIKMAEARQMLPLVWQRWITRNDYRDMRPYRNPHVEATDREEIYFCNGYLNVMTLNKPDSK